MSTLRRFTRLLLVCAFVWVVGFVPGTALPTQTTITVDGNMSDWAAVLGNPENVFVDGFPDADAPVAPERDLVTGAFTWDTTYLYFYVRRQARTSDHQYLWFYFDLDNDGLVADDSPLLDVRWKANGNTDVALDRYLAASPAGDPITSALGAHDGHALPGGRRGGPSVSMPDGGTSNGLEIEVRVAWADLGVPPGSSIQVHIASTSRPSGFPGAIDDNLGGGAAISGLDLSPDLSVTALAGDTVIGAHTITNLGGAADVFDLTWTATGAFAPAAMTFYGDTDASGTLTAPDQPLTDTDGDGVVDTGAVAGSGSTFALLAAIVVPPSAVLGQTAVVTLEARSSFAPSAFDTVTDTITVLQPSLTLLKTVDKATAPPGGVLSYTVLYTNTGSADAFSVTVIDPVPANATFIAGSASGAGMTVQFSHDGGASYDGSDVSPVTHVQWTLGGALSPGGTGTVSYQVAID